MSEEEIEDLPSLDESRFSHKEWLLLRYAELLTSADGAEPKGDFVEDLEKHLSPQEKAYVGKLVRLQSFINRVAATFLPIPRLAVGASSKNPRQKIRKK
jgi:hypothetical protein